ncbi:membrane protein insertase YidC [Polyangium fumosum]|uniref:Membrane protein insertase YidC n=1 Tax=Polyangium fumosum TaxID=889272 RepID=A0A4U1JBU1_9BACT|nr:membrane protein insertase YidC [Polyangium fumosum]TKD07508.1 membrane protein insertase YidC [Polyangium fumosum]
MERGKIVQWVLIGIAAILFWQFGGNLFGKGNEDVQPNTFYDADRLPDDKRQPEQICTINGPRFEAELSSRGGSLRHLRLTDEGKYSKAGKPIDLVTTSQEWRQPLRTDVRLPGVAKQQTPYDNLDWTLAAQDGKSCTFVYEDATSKLTKVVRETGNPFELEMTLEVKNLSAEPLKHRLTVEQTSWRTTEETKGSLGRISEQMTDVLAATTEKVERLHADAFEPKDFKDKEFTNELWRRSPGAAKWVAVSSVYFTKAAIPVEGPAAFAETQIEEDWNRAKYNAADREKDKDTHGHVYRARLAYPEVELAPQATQTYKVLSFTGPKEREVLAAAGPGITEVIDLGTFSPIAKVLVGYLKILHKAVGSWGWAIALLTITVRTLLFPLSISQIKSSAAMRRLKPEMDELNTRYKDDPAQRGLALQELWRKHGVTNPVLGCIPMLLQMPVWFALYQALQTAVELYHVPFLSARIIPDLSDKGEYFVIPAILGASSFFQQKLMPPQSDPMQQKMMQYMLPGIFVVMMLYLPAGLGVYMLTNTWLGIAQQVAVERYLSRKTQGSAGIEVREKPAKSSGDETKSAPALGKGKARVRG